MKLVSACLCGINSKYNGSNNLNPVFKTLLARGEVLPVCPEQLGGLPTPRAACEIKGGSGLDVINHTAEIVGKDGQNYTPQFIRGAEEVLHLAKEIGINEAILQSHSPSCGCGQIYDGSFSSRLVDGDGVTTALLRRHGLRVLNEQEFLKSGNLIQFKNT